MISLSIEPAIVACGYCGLGVRGDQAESCWFCSGPLCDVCWEVIGHCGHEDCFRQDAEIRRMLRELVPE